MRISDWSSDVCSSDLPDLTVEALKQRALALCRWSIARGTLAIRRHVDICDDRLLAVDALLEVRATVKPWIDLQLVAFPQDGYRRYAKSPETLKRAPDKGFDVMGRSEERRGGKRWV